MQKDNIRLFRNVAKSKKIEKVKGRYESYYTFFMISKKIISTKILSTKTERIKVLEPPFLIQKLRKWTLSNLCVTPLISYNSYIMFT